MIYALKNYTSIVIYEKSFFFVHLHSYTRQNFLYTRALKTLSLYINMVYKTSIPFQRFLFPFFNIHSLFIQKLSLYTLIVHTQEFLFTQSLFIHFLYTETLFFSLYTDMTFVHNAPFFFYFGVIMMFVRFRTTFLNENSRRFRNLNKHYQQ